MVAATEGSFPDSHEEAFITQLHLGQLFAFEKCTIGDRRDGGINPNTDYILRDSSSSFSCVDEELYETIHREIGEDDTPSRPQLFGGC
jgi:hypothetical protein